MPKQKNIVFAQTMNLIPLDITALTIGEPIPICVRNSTGLVVVPRGHVLQSHTELAQWISEGEALFADSAELLAQQRHFVNQLHGLLCRNAPLGDIANTRLNLNRIARDEERRDMPDWRDLQWRAHRLLNKPHATDFLPGLERLSEELMTWVHRKPDALLFALFYLSAQERRTYSATHALLVCAMCSIAAKDVLHWPSVQQQRVARVALTMNISMTGLQDQLAVQPFAPTSDQRRTLDLHAARSAELLRRAGVDDTAWLDAVRGHHDRMPGPLRERSPAMQVARLVHRADMLSARLSPRETRQPLPSAVALHASYFAENHEVDEAGAALIKAVGVFSPGTFVRLSSDELAIVTRRGLNTAAPRVAVLVNRSGMPLTEPVLRQTGTPSHQVICGVPQHEVKVSINLARMLSLI